MKLYILIGTLVATMVVASCAAEPDERGPTTVGAEVPAVVGDLVEPADATAGDGAVGNGDPHVSSSVAPVPTATTPPEAAGEVPGVETADVGSPEPSDPAPEVTEPTVPDLPEPGGPWIDPRQPDFTKTVPPPQR